jgi:addiction module HigA family antidote
MGAKWADVMGAFPPGKLIRAELEARGWTQQELAKRMKRPVQAISMIVNGRKAITAETALQLQEAFGASAGMWMGLEADWQLFKESERQKARERSPEAVQSLSMTAKHNRRTRGNAGKQPVVMSSLSTVFVEGL